MEQGNDKIFMITSDYSDNYQEDEIDIDGELSSTVDTVFAESTASYIVSNLLDKQRVCIESLLSKNNNLARNFGLEADANYLEVYRDAELYSSKLNENYMTLYKQYALNFLNKIPTSHS